MKWVLAKGKAQNFGDREISAAMGDISTRVMQAIDAQTERPSSEAVSVALRPSRIQFARVLEQVESTR